jgi:hypothetical protein
MRWKQIGGGFFPFGAACFVAKSRGRAAYFYFAPVEGNDLQPPTTRGGTTCHLRWGQLPSAGPRQKEGAGWELAGYMAPDGSKLMVSHPIRNPLDTVNLIQLGGASAPQAKAEAAADCRGLCQLKNQD